jgi:TP901 family phage tail tape measure protein
LSEKIGLEAVLDTDNFDRGVSQYLTAVERMSNSTVGFASAASTEFANLGGVIAGAATAAVTAAAAIAGATGKAVFDWTAEGVGMAKDLEEQISAIAAVMSKSKEEVAPLSDLISELSLDPSLKVNTTQAADAIELLARNGIDMTDILNGAARSTVLLANATDADFGMAADLATDVMSIFNIEAKDMQTAVNGITSVVNNSKFTIDDYRLAMARGGASAEAAGVSFDDFNAIIAFSASAFSSGQVAGTGWANLLTRLVPQSSTAADGMKELGLITEEGANQFFDANGNLKDMNEIIDVLNGAFGGLTEEQRISYAQMIFGRDAAGALNSVIGKTSQEFLSFKEVMGQTDAEVAAKTRMDNLAGALEILQGVIEAIQIQVGSTFLPVLTEMARALTGVLEGRAVEIVAVFGALAEWAAEAATNLIPLAQEVLPKIIDNIIALAQWAIEAARTGNVWNEWLDKMDPRLASWIERMVAIQAAIAEVTGKIGEIIEWIGQAISPITEFVANFVSVEDVVITAGLAVAAFLAPLALAIVKMAAVGAAATLAVAAIRDAWEMNLGGVRDFVAQVWEQIQGIVATGMEIVQTLWSGHGNALSDLAASAWETIKGVISGALNIVQGVLDTVLAAVQGDWETVWANISNAATTIWEGIKTAWNAALGALTQFLADHWPTWSAKLGEWASAAWQWITQTAIPLALQKLGEWGTALWQWVSDNLPTWTERLGAWAAAAWEWLVEAAKQIPTKLGEWWSALSTWLAENLPTWQERLGEWGATAWQWIVDAAGQVPAKLAEWWTALVTWYDNNKEAWVTKLSEWATAAWQWIVDAATELPKKLGEWWAAIKTWLDENLPLFQEKLKDWTQALVDWVTNATPGTTKSLGEWYTETSGWFATKFIDFEVGLVQWTTSLVEWIGNAIPGMITAIADFVEGLVTWMVGGGGDQGMGMIGEGLEAWIQAFIDWVSGENGLITRLVPEWQKLGAAIIDAVVNIATAIQEAKERINAAFVVALAFVGTAIIDGIKQGIDGATGGLMTTIGDLATQALDAAKAALGIQSPSKEFEEIGAQSIFGFEGGIVDNTRYALEAATSLTQEFLKKFDVILSKLPTVAKDSMAEFVQLFQSGMAAAVQLATSRVVDFMKSFDVVMNQLPKVALDAMTQFNSAMAAGFQQVTSAAQNFASSLLSFFGSFGQQLIGQFQTLASQAAQGFVGGLDSMLGVAQAKVTELGNLAAQALATSLEAQSPSRVFFREGEGAGQGFVNGILAKLQDARYAAAQLGDAAAAAVAQKALDVASYVGSLGVVPTGAPDVDMNALQKAQYQQATGKEWQPTDIQPAMNYYANAKLFEQLTGKAWQPTSYPANSIDPAMAYYDLLRKGAEEALGIHSPSTYFEWIGEMSGEGFLRGWEQKLAEAQSRIMQAFDLSGIQVNLDRFVSQQLAARNAVSTASSIQSYATTNQVSNQFGPFNVSTPMDWAEMEFRMRRIIAESI